MGSSLSRTLVAQSENIAPPDLPYTPQPTFPTSSASSNRPNLSSPYQAPFPTSVADSRATDYHSRELRPTTAEGAAVRILRVNGKCTPCSIRRVTCRRAVSSWNIQTGQWDWPKTVRGNPMCQTCASSENPDDCDSLVIRKPNTHGLATEAGITAGSFVFQPPLS